MKMIRIEIPDNTRREGPPFPRIQGTSSSNLNGKILTLGEEREEGEGKNKKNRENQGEGGAAVTLYILSFNLSTKRPNYPYIINYTLRPDREIFIGASDRHAAFTILLRLDASFAMVPRALHPDLDRAKSAPGFAAEIGKPATTDGFEAQTIETVHLRLAVT